MRIIYIPLVIFMLFASLNCAANVANKDRSGWYVGGTMGTSTTSAEINNTFSQKNSADSFGVYGGFNFTDWFGLEGMFLQTGDVSDNRANLVSSDFTGLLFSPKFSFRVTNIFSMYAKAGLALLIYTEEYDNTILFVRDDHESWSSIISSYGIGGEFDIIHGIKIRLSYDSLTGSLGSNDETYYRNIPDVQAELKQISLGMHYQF